MRIAESHAVREIIDQLSAELCGPVQVTVLVSLAQHALLKLLPEFLTKCGGTEHQQPTHEFD